MQNSGEERAVRQFLSCAETMQHHCLGIPPGRCALWVESAVIDSLGSRTRRAANRQKAAQQQLFARLTQPVDRETS